MTIQILSRNCTLTLVALPGETWHDTIVRGYSNNRGEPYEVACYRPCGPRLFSVRFRKARADVSGMEPAVLVKVDPD